MKFLIVAAAAAISMASSVAAQARLAHNEPRGVFKMYHSDGSRVEPAGEQILNRRGGGGGSSSTSKTSTSSSAGSSSTSVSSVTSVPPPPTTTATPTSTLSTTGVPSSCTTTSSAQPKITYAGGPLLVNGINVYGVFYGDHSQDTIDKVGTFVNSLGKSSRWAVDRTYKDSNGNHINDQITWKGYYHDSTLTQGTDISGKTQAIIDNAVAKMGWPKKDPIGIYNIFVGVGVKESMGSIFQKQSLCTDYCGYHNTDSNGRLFTIIGDAVACPGTLPAPGQCKGTAGCMQRPYRNQTDTTYSINGNQHADSMIDVLIHEIGETASDYSNGYRDSAGEENADKCAAYYINYLGSGAGTYNVDFSSSGGSKYLVQSQWSLDLQKCALSA
ncbi:hypothetical protein HDU76_000680 [Blyttiomyces sp. JEL0837]|nr:hypothetical protein HDU76_000680 [Blyttiomyces sp. JEL0837]